MVKAWKDSAWAEFEDWISRDRKTVSRILRLLKDIDRNGYHGIGKPEPLREDWSGYWSCRIDQKNRLIFKIDGETIWIEQCASHYGDK